MVHADDGRLTAAAARLRAAAAARAGVFAREQARECGFSAAAVRRRIDQGIWVRYRGAFVRAGTPDTERARAWAAVLVVGEGAVITGPVACRLRGVPLDQRFAGELMVIVPVDRHVALPGARTVRTDVAVAQVGLVDGLPVATVGRALVDAFRYLPSRDATALLDRAVQQRWISAETLAAWVAYLVGRYGIRQLRRLAQRAQVGAHSEAERVALRLVRRAGIPGLDTDHHIHVDGRLVARLDLAFPAAMVAIEVDGMAYHSDAVRFQRDRTRQNLLVSLGWTVLRFTWWDLVDRPDYVVTTIRRAVRAAA